MMQLVHTRAQTGRSMTALIAAINQDLIDRNINATRALTRSNSAIVGDTGKVVTALGYALDYWTRAGSGSPPGTRTDFVQLYRWAKAKGLGRTDRETLRIAALTSRKIRKFGSRDWREGNVNVYLNRIDDFDKRGLFLPEDGAEKDLDKFAGDTFKNIN